MSVLIQNYSNISCNKIITIIISALFDLSNGGPQTTGQRWKVSLTKTGWRCGTHNLSQWEHSLIDNTYSLMLMIHQGSILGPQLLTPYINIYSPKQYCNTHFYADDTIFYAFGATANQAFSRLPVAFNDLQTSLFN